jgi:Mg-chelatase subunit ChlD
MNWIEAVSLGGFENPVFLALIMLAVPALYFGFKSDEKFHRIVGVTKFLTISLLVVAASAPFIQADQSVMEEPEIVILSDESNSAQLLEKPDFDFGEVSVERKIIASGNNSELEQGLMRNLEENKAYLLISDLQSSSNLEKVSQKFRDKNSTLNAFKAPTREDASVAVKGPSSTVPGAENSFRVRVHSTADIPEPEVTLDGENVDLEKKSENSWRFSKTFQEEGEHAIEASVDSNDYFAENNNFYKTVKVRQKPEVLMVGQEAGLGSELKQFYDVKYRDSIPDDLSDYYTVISKKPFKDVDVADYLVEGNGLVYTGEPKERNVLPTQPIDREDQSKGAKIMLAIDVSQSTEESGSVKKEKKIAYSLVDKMGYNNKVGAVAYNQESYLLTEPKPLSRNRNNLKQKISQLETGGNSFHHKGIQGAEESLNETGNIILITDGKITRYGERVNTARKSRSTASNLDVRLLTVGVGEDRNEEFLEDLARRGNGDYLEADNSGRLSFRFGAGGTSGRSERIVVVDKSHFITENLEADTSITGYPPVRGKLGADLLVTSNTGKPYLTTWRYGLGRVAAFTGGTNDLGELLTYDPKLATRTVSWTVGDPQRKQDKWIKIEDSRKGETVEIRASYDIEGLSRQSDDLYTGELEPEETGFRSFSDITYGYNYNEEIQQIGYSENLKDLVESTGGTVYSPDQTEEIKEDIKNFSNKTVTRKKSVADYFIIAALLIFLSEVGYRKKRGKK